jgi:hypothetical protein
MGAIAGKMDFFFPDVIRQAGAIYHSDHIYSILLAIKLDACSEFLSEYKSDDYHRDFFNSFIYFAGNEKASAAKRKNIWIFSLSGIIQD